MLLVDATDSVDDTVDVKTVELVIVLTRKSALFGEKRVKMRTRAKQ